MLTKIAQQKQKGFTLIELMIVVAIIGILAAIAIPQFAAYRIKAFNSAAMSDLHSVRLAEEALFADYQKYGSTVATTGTAGTTGGTKLTTSGFVATDTANNETPVSVSNGVELQTEVGDIAKGLFASTVSQHTQGNKLYTSETDQAGTYQKSVTVGTALAPTGAATSALDATGFTVM